MKYYTIVLNVDNIFNKYLLKSNGDFALISFCEDDFADIYRLFKQASDSNDYFDKGMLQAVIFEFVGEDNYLYRMSYSDAEITKTIKWPLKKLIKQYENNDKFSLEVKKAEKDIFENYQEDTIVKQKSFIPNYQKYKFIDRENLISTSFRLKKSNKKRKMPLVIYFHGAGALGNDNINQFVEYKCMCMGLSKKNCHVLVPQFARAVGENIAIITKYCKSIKKLVEKLSEIVQIDFDRIYIVGASLGGACVWYSLYTSPRFYAAAIPLMGYFPTYNSSNFDIKTFEKETIWIGHAENDNVVSIKDDQTMFGLLKEAGYNVKMTTYKKYGHKMSGVFIRKEKWKKWLFEQKL